MLVALPFTPSKPNNTLSPPPPQKKNHGASSLGTRNYREALLSSPIVPLQAHAPPQRKPMLLLCRCFRYLATDHKVKHCRDPVVCTACRSSGHRQDNCPSFVASNFPFGGSAVVASTTSSSANLLPLTPLPLPPPPPSPPPQPRYPSSTRFSAKWVRKAKQAQQQ